uniref:NADH dehydrogenase subunit 9 n=1 Tax=Chloropicon sieburthii TaxID=1764286 RepID=A0A4D6C6H7_9CHLO|nr:NADH dehydrogenase subunit 9 [Chloropicon sieburthii]QBX98639.1 NADH dehydrogenase subunit 9 [Chloropicon sieburthii]
MKLFLQHLMLTVPGLIKEIRMEKNEGAIIVEPENVRKILTFLRDHTSCQYKLLVELCGADYPSRETRFEVVYELLSVSSNTRLRVKTPVDEFKGVSSVTSLYKNAIWSERETWDLYGIFFKDHPDLRRILTDYGFEGYPLRKDFPLSGFTEVRYDESSKRVIYEPLEMPQEFRSFDLQTPWNPLMHREDKS